MSIIIDSKELNGTTYYSTILRGVEYTAYFSKPSQQWAVKTHRLALGRTNGGSCKFYETLAALSAGCKAFANLDVLLSA